MWRYEMSDRASFLKRYHASVALEQAFLQGEDVGLGLLQVGAKNGEVGGQGFLAVTEPLRQKPFDVWGCTENPDHGLQDVEIEELSEAGTVSDRERCHRMAHDLEEGHGG